MTHELVDAADVRAPRVISAIVPEPRKPGRFSVMVDGDELATLSIEVIERLRLTVGTVVEPRLAAEIAREAGILAVVDRALNMLAFRARASSELRRLLIRKQQPPDLVDLALARLTAAGYLDDRVFARQFTRSRVIGAGLSRRRVQQELARRGVARETAIAAIDEVFVEEQVDESESIERVARKKLRTLASVEAPVRRRRLYGFLARRGYDADDIARVLRSVLDPSDTADEA